MPSRLTSTRPLADPVLGQPVSPFGWFEPFDGSAVRSRAAGAGSAALSGSLPIARLLPACPLGLGALAGFLPASRIDGQSLPWGRCCSLFTATVGNRVLPPRPTSDDKLSRTMTPPSPSSSDGC